MSNCCNDAKTCAEMARLEQLVKENTREVYAALLKQDKKIADLACRFNGDIQKAIAEYLRIMEAKGELSEIITDTLLNDIFMMQKRTSGVINVKEFGAYGNGVCDDTAAIQKAIDHANEVGATVHIPRGTYLISNSIFLNGCTIQGEPGNIFHSLGAVFMCLKKGFTAIRQGSTKTENIQFNVSDITVVGATVGFEIVYAINSKFERLYAVDCNTGFKIGDPSAVGCMFCEFNNLYTRGCAVGIDSHSKEYFNNNRFNNGYIYGSDYAMKLRVSGGYGAVGNVFNNVEFRSEEGRGILLTSCLNIVFNSCYFEAGGNVLRMSNYCSIYLNNGTYAIYKKDNRYADKNVIYTEGGGQLTIYGGTVFLSDEYQQIAFFGAANDAIHQNIQIVKTIEKNGSATGFKMFENNHAVKGHSQVVNTSTITVAADGKYEFDFAYDVPFNAIPKLINVTMRGASGAERGLSYVLSERTETGGKISVSNTSTGARSVSFAIYAKDE